MEMRLNQPAFLRARCEIRSSDEVGQYAREVGSMMKKEGCVRAWQLDLLLEAHNGNIITAAERFFFFFSFYCCCDSKKWRVEEWFFHSGAVFSLAAFKKKTQKVDQNGFFTEIPSTSPGILRASVEQV